jgi:signal recognition particle receptor subunit beta
MPYVDHGRKELRFKIVYCGAGLSGKTTNLELIHQRTRADRRGKLLVMPGANERTVFFDLLPVEIGRYKDYDVRVHLCTVPGQVEYAQLRQTVLRNVDGVVVVIDCERGRAAGNRGAIRDLERNLQLLGHEPAKLPTVVQWNKRDLAGPNGVERMRTALKIPPGVVQVVASARAGEGVFETLKAVLKECLSAVAQPSLSPPGHSPLVIASERDSLYPPPPAN